MSGETLAIAGSGAIATGLAACAARTPGHVLWARSPESASRAARAIATACERLGPTHLPEHVRISLDLADLSTGTFIVESIAENLAAKQELLGRLARMATDAAIIASTTSSLCVRALAAATGRPEMFVGFHVFNPVPKMPLVELAFPPEASSTSRDRARALAEALGKTPMEAPAIPGFVVNRLLFPYLFSAVDYMECTGLSPDVIDSCMQLGAGHPMGPLALLDYIGLDVSLAIGEALELPVPGRIRTLVAEGRLGRKTRSGLLPPARYES